MRINITARHFKLSDHLRNYVENEISRLNRYYDGIVDVEIILSCIKKHRLAEINVSVYGTLLKAHGRSEDVHQSVDRAVEKLERQLKKYKDRMRGFEHETIVSHQYQGDSNKALEREE
jgi:putative sigma-54 modulation protein